MIEKNTSQWQVLFEEKRKGMNVSLKKISKLTDISSSHLSDILKGKRNCSSTVKEKLELALEKCNPKYEMTVIFDYFRVSFPTRDYDKIIQQVLMMKSSYFVTEARAFYGYDFTLKFRDISLLCTRLSSSENRGLLLELRGKGCRQLEYLLIAQNRTWQDFILACMNFNGAFKRVDIAVNDTAGILSIPSLAKKVGTAECETVFKKYQVLSSSETLSAENWNEKKNLGSTIYIGSMKSDIYFCIYEKDYEQFVKQGIPIEEAEVKNRFEIRLKNDRAQVALMNYFNSGDIEDIAFSIIKRYLCFFDEEKDKPVEEWNINYRWAWFIGEGREPLKLTMKPETYSLDRTLSWVRSQVAPTLAMLNRIDTVDGTHLIKDICNIKLPARQRQILRQYRADVYDVVNENNYTIDKENLSEVFKKDELLALKEKYHDACEKLKEREKEIERLRSFNF